VDPQEPEILDQSEYPSVERLFDVIAENEAGGSMRVVVKYAAVTGVPLSIDITCADERIADCGVTHTISNLEISG
ncbi:MAG TPA: DUF6174 domain-containing protein, partial [Acidimicrobiia bacterium]|nr:DUF6174 domain-containing protein [Acidimicrobiia bacterium]